MLNADVERP